MGIFADWGTDELAREAAEKGQRWMELPGVHRRNDRPRVCVWIASCGSTCRTSPTTATPARSRISS